MSNVDDIKHIGTCTKCGKEKQELYKQDITEPSNVSSFGNKVYNRYTIHLCEDCARELTNEYVKDGEKNEWYYG